MRYCGTSVWNSHFNMFLNCLKLLLLDPLLTQLAIIVNTTFSHCSLCRYFPLKQLG